MAAIEGLGPVPVNQARRPASRGAACFTMGTAAEPCRTPAARASLDPVAGMIGLQEADTDPPRDRAARRHGRALLAALARLQQGLLGGLADGAAVAELATLAHAEPDAADPALAAVVQAIALRARIELARRGR